MLGTSEKEEPVFDERKMSVLLTTEHPLNPPDTSQKSAQEHIKGSEHLQCLDILHKLCQKLRMIFLISESIIKCVELPNFSFKYR